MTRKILIIDGHPDPDPSRYGHELGTAYEEGAREVGHEVRRVRVANMTFPILRTGDDFNEGKEPVEIASVQADVRWADHIVIVFPLWLGSMPALTKAFFEQLFRPGFAFSTDKENWKSPLLKPKSARVVVTMGMPAWVYRYVYFAHGVRGMERNILKFVGLNPVKESLIGSVETCSQQAREDWLEIMRDLGRIGN